MLGKTGLKSLRLKKTLKTFLKSFFFFENLAANVELKSLSPQLLPVWCSCAFIEQVPGEGAENE